MQPGHLHPHTEKGVIETISGRSFMYHFSFTKEEPDEDC